MRRPNRRRTASASAATPLPPVLDLKEAAPLAASLLARRGSPLVVDGSAVERLGAQCLQVLLAAQKTWQADGQHFQLANPSPALTGALSALGASVLEDEPGAEVIA